MLVSELFFEAQLLKEKLLNPNGPFSRLVADHGLPVLARGAKNRKSVFRCFFVYSNAQCFIPFFDFF